MRTSPPFGPPLPPPARLAEEWLPPAAVLLLATGVLVAITGAATHALPAAVGGTAVAAMALIVLVGGGWLDGLVLLALALPLPALATAEFARVSPAALLTAVVVAAWFVASGAAGRRLAPSALPRRSVAAFAAAVLLSAVFAEHRAAAAREMVNLLLLFTLLVVATGELTRSPRRVRALASWTVAAAGLAGFAAALQTVGVLPGRFLLADTSLYRATAGFGWPNELGMFMAVALPLAIHAFRSARTPGRRAGTLVLLAGATVGLAVTFSRGSWLAFLTAAPVLLLVGGRRLLFVLMLGVAAAAAVINLLLGGVLLERAASLIGDPYVGQRAALMLTGVLMFLAHPLVGVGPGGFAESLGDFGPRVEWLWDYVGSAHNAYIEVAAELGTFGLLAFVALLGSTLLTLLRSARREHQDAGADAGFTLRKALLWSFATVCTVSFTVWPFAHGIGQLVVLVAAMGLALAATDAHGSPA